MYVNSSFLKHAVKASVLVLGLAVGTGVAHADSMNFSGSTTGTFSSTGTNQLRNGANQPVLTFTTDNFNGNTSNSGFVGFGGTNANGSFGSFLLSTNTATFNNDPFALTVTFTNPAGVQNGQTSSFSATVLGSVTSNVGGGAQVTFSPASQTYSFANGMQSGTFTLNLNNLALFAGQTTVITGNIQATATSVTPEPNSLMLLGTGLVSTAGMMLRRRKMQTA